MKSIYTENDNTLQMDTDAFNISKYISSSDKIEYCYDKLLYIIN